MQLALRQRGARLSTRIRHIENRSLAIGLVVVTVAVVGLAVAGVLYVSPPAQKTVTFETTDAAALNTGEEVRVAGVAVGKVSKISIEPKTVRVEARVSDNTFVGDRSQVSVRMLTPVGGYAVTIIPIGDQSLGHAVIPVDRVSVPYSIGDVLQSVPHVTGQVNGDTVNANIDQVADALQHNSTSIKSVIAGMNSIATVMDQQRDQVRKIMDLSSEYLRTFQGSRQFVFDLLQQIDTVVSTYENAHVGFDEAYFRLGDLLARVEPVFKFYVGHKKQVLAAVTTVRGAIENLQKTLGPGLDNLKSLQQRLEAWLGPDGLKELGGGTISAPNICIPIPGRIC